MERGGRPFRDQPSRSGPFGSGPFGSGLSAGRLSKTRGPRPVAMRSVPPPRRLTRSRPAGTASLNPKRGWEERCRPVWLRSRGPCWRGGALRRSDETINGASCASWRPNRGGGVTNVFAAGRELWRAYFGARNRYEAGESRGLLFPSGCRGELRSSSPWRRTSPTGQSAPAAGQVRSTSDKRCPGDVSPGSR